MQRFEPGTVCRSLAGHDAGNYYIIIKTDETHVYVADGRLRTAAEPKRKNRKHIKPMRETVFPESFGKGEIPEDAEIRKALKKLQAGFINEEEE